MSFVRKVAAATVACVSFIAVAPAHADPQADAKDLFVRGRDLRQGGDCSGASEMFRRAYQVYPHGLGSLRNLAECEEQLGHYASARRAWLDLKRGVNLQPNDPKYEGWDKDAVDAAARLKPRVALVTVDVIVKSPQYEGPASDKTGAELYINGEKVASNLIGTELDRDPGTYTFRAQAPDAQPVEQKFSLAAGDVRQIKLRLLVVPKAAPAQEDLERAERARTQKTWGYVALGVGGVTLGGALATALIFNGAKSDVERECPSLQDCPRSLESTKDTGELMATLTNVLLPVGIVFAGVGITLLATAKSTDPTKTSSTVRLSPTFGGAALGGTF